MILDGESQGLLPGLGGELDDPMRGVNPLARATDVIGELQAGWPRGRLAWP
ncbi:hypothetical protein [Sorangium sp. So ce854]|uniref:hypothetical protein n=1 Tax=Sorangium sp. So ce854 TaxID=3133322 RepID=UPI003F5E2469